MQLRTVFPIAAFEDGTASPMSCVKSARTTGANSITPHISNRRMVYTFSLFPISLRLRINRTKSTILTTYDRPVRIRDRVATFSRRDVRAV